MTGKPLNNSSAGILILILPLALSIVILYKLWPLLLLLALSIVAFRIWQNYQWQKWCAQVNPYFNQLIKENRGYLTPVDLSLKANLTAKAAKSFLEGKASDYGVAPKIIPDKGIVYYFPTASALGSILDDSEPETESELSLNSYESAASESGKVSFRGIASLAKQEQTQQQQISEHSTSAATDVAELESESPVATESSAVDEAEITTTDEERFLIQADLAKRLDLNSSTVGRRKLDEDFPEWSQSKDPEGIAWKYIPETKHFVPMDEN
ncbi:hypothetical protein [Myxosarcina sp. GI1(2024)]